MTEMAGHQRFSGRILPGRGKASGQLAAMSAEMDRITGETLFPGSLNVILEWPLMLDEKAAGVFDEGRRMMWRATLNDAPVWIYRWRHAPLHAAEILSTFRLRDHLGLRDGDRVTLTLPRQSVGTVKPLGFLAWAACGLGRRPWCYTHDAYYRRTASRCRKWGATQA